MALTVEDLAAPQIGSWQDDAACNGLDPELFFSSDDEAQRRALELCKTCPVREECLRWAVEHREMYGIWGGMEESDRRSLIRERRRRRREAERTAEAA